MSPISVMLLTLSAVSVMIYFGNNFSKLHMSKGSWLIVTTVLCIIFVIDYVIENIVKKRKN